MKRPVYKLVHNMLEQALERLESGDQVILHSDQGWHYQMKKYQQTLKQHGITQSMSRKGNCPYGIWNLIRHHQPKSE